MDASGTGPLIVGIGNPDRGDDALGWRLAERLRARRDLRVVTVGGEPAGLLALLADVAAAVLVDAAEFDAPPGTILRLDAAAAPLPGLAPGCSSHGLGLAAAIELGRILGSLPSRCVLYAVQGAQYEPGTGLSRPVAAALPELEARILAEVAATHA